MNKFQNLQVTTANLVPQREIDEARDARMWGFVVFANRFNQLANDGRLTSTAAMTGSDGDYFGNLVKQDIPGLDKIGDQLVFVDRKQRQVILTKTRVGNVVAFRRYSPTDGNKAITHNIPDALRGIVPSGNLGGNEDAVTMLVGGTCQSNIGETLEDLRTDLM